MNLVNKKYFREDLNNDVDGKKWQLMFSSVIDKANYMKFTLGSVDNYNEIENKITEGKSFVHGLGFSKNLIEIYATNFHFQRMYKWHYIIARLSIDSKLKDKVSSFKTLLEYIFKGDDDYDIFDPAFYHNETALLWTVSTMSLANIILTEKQRDIWIRKGFVLNKV